jgi:hypothetical protein
MSKKRTFKTAALVEVNRHILEAARDSITQEQEWEFFCECGHPDCGEHLKLSIEEYAGLRDGDAAVLADGHTLSRAEQARRRAQELREESEALRAQATHQVRRSKKRTA